MISDDSHDGVIEIEGDDTGSFAIKREVVDFSSIIETTSSAASDDNEMPFDSQLSIKILFSIIITLVSYFNYNNYKFLVINVQLVSNNKKNLTSQMQRKSRGEDDGL